MKIRFLSHENEYRCARDTSNFTPCKLSVSTFKLKTKMLVKKKKIIMSLYNLCSKIGSSFSIYP